jgi:predicted nucleic acid-binding protein
MSESSALHVLTGKPVFIVDSWPVLEWIYRKEPATARFRERLEAAERGEFRLLVSRINYAEISYNVAIKKRLGEFVGTVPDLASLPWQVVSVDDALVDEAARLKSSYPISFADCFAVALARRYNAPVITGDPDFKKLADRGVVLVEWIGE